MMAAEYKQKLVQGLLDTIILEAGPGKSHQFLRSCLNVDKMYFHTRLTGKVDIANGYFCHV